MSWAVITGASAGFGVEFAKLCVADGHSVILVARRKDRLDDLARELQTQNTSIQAKVIAMDLSTPGSGKKLYEQVSAITPDVEILINNAGFGAAGTFPIPDLAKQLEMIDLNIRSLTELTGLFLPNMRRRRMGRILNVGSLAGFQPGPYMSVYYASKAYVNSFSEALHEELADSGVTCTVLAPGPSHTEFGSVAKVDTARLFKQPTFVSPSVVAKVGYCAMKRGQAMAIPGVTNKLLPQLQRLTPRSFIRKTAAWLNRGVSQESV